MSKLINAINELLTQMKETDQIHQVDVKDITMAIEKRRKAHEKKKEIKKGAEMKRIREEENERN